MNFDFQMTETLATDILVYVVVGVRHPNYCPSTYVILLVTACKFCGGFLFNILRYGGGGIEY